MLLHINIIAGIAPCTQEEARGPHRGREEVAVHLSQARPSALPLLLPAPQLGGGREHRAQDEAAQHRAILVQDARAEERGAAHPVGHLPEEALYLPGNALVQGTHA